MYSKSYYLTVVTVMFEMESYEFNEGETAAEVCVVLDGSIQGEISVQIIIDDMAAQGITPI